jgi:hypothetical protein
MYEYKYYRISRYILNEDETRHHLILIRLYFILTILITEDDWEQVYNHIINRVGKMCVAATSLCMIVLIFTRKRGDGRYYFALWQTNNTPNKLLLSESAESCLLRVRSVSFKNNYLSTTTFYGISDSKACYQFIKKTKIILTGSLLKSLHIKHFASHHFPNHMINRVGKMCAAAMSLCMIVLIVTRKRGDGRYYFALWQTNNNTPNKLLLSKSAESCWIKIIAV